MSVKLILLQTGDDRPAGGTGLDVTGPFTQLRGSFEVAYDHEDSELLKVDEAPIAVFKAFESMQYNCVVAQLKRTTSARPVRVRHIVSHIYPHTVLFGIMW